MLRYVGGLTSRCQILGIGDQSLSSSTSPYILCLHVNHPGVGAVLISVAKLVLTTLCAGIHPSRTLPVVLDCGTDVSSFVSYGGKA